MANELSVNLSLAFKKGAISTTMTSGTAQMTVTGTDYIRETYTAPTSITALPLGAITSPGYCMITNKDATNYVDIYPSTTGDETIRLMPGDWAIFRFAAAAPAVKAHTATCKIEFIIIAQ